MNAIESPLFIVGIIVLMLIPILLTLLIARFRGVVSALFFLPFFIPLMVLVFKEIPGFNTFMTQNDFCSGVVQGITYYNDAFYNGINKYVLYGFTLIAPNNTNWVNIVNQTWFSIALYGVLFVLVFSFIHKRNPKKSKSRYDDDF